MFHFSYCISTNNVSIVTFTVKLPPAGEVQLTTSLATNVSILATLPSTVRWALKASEAYLSLINTLLEAS